MTHIMMKATFAGLLIASGSVHAENYNFKPGLWETTTTSEELEMKNLPPELEEMRNRFKSLVEAMPQDNIDIECLESIEDLFSDKDEEHDEHLYHVEDDYNENDEDIDNEQNCEVKRERISANKMMITSLCTDDESTSNVVGELILNGTTLKYEAIATSTHVSGMSSKIKVVSNSKYIGTCN